MVVDEQNFTWLHRMNGIEDNTLISQYMDLDYFLMILRNKCYHVNRKFTFEDKNEQSFPDNRIVPFVAVGENVNPQPEPDLAACMRIRNSIVKNKTVPTACWTLSTTEKMSMWKMFSSKFGVRIKSSVHNVVASIKENKYDIWCGKMTYNGYYADKGFMENMFSKVPCYSEEEECRFYFFEYESRKDSNDLLPYIEIKIDPAVMIDEVILSPYIAPDASEILVDFINGKYNIPAIPSKSK